MAHAFPSWFNISIKKVMRFILILFILLPLFSFAQKKKHAKDTSLLISQLHRIEFEKQREEVEFYVVPGGIQGVLVVEDTRNNVSGGYEWKMYMVDTAFNIVWTQSQVVPVSGTLLGYEYFNGTFYLLFSKNLFRSEELLVYQLSIHTQDCLTYEITTVFPVEISHFESVGETLLIAGYANFRPVVITYNIRDRIPRVVPGFYESKNDLLDLVVDEEAEFFTAILSERMRNKRYTVRVKTFTSKGDLIQDNLVDPGDKKSLLDAASTTFSSGLQYLAGTHSKKSLLYSQGFYLSKFVNGVQQFNQYYPFADLNNFFAHLKPKREMRIKSKIERKKQRGKIKKFSYRLLVHRIIQREDEYIMIAEAYYPRYNYSNSSRGAFIPYGYTATSSRGGYPSLNPYFLGYKYTHAVVVGFDRNCNIIWDNTFRIEDIQSYSLEENVKVASDHEKIVLMYLEENEIRSKVISGNEVVEGRTFNPVKLFFESDEVKTRDPKVEGLHNWYGSTLFAYGEHNIRNEHGIDGKHHRKVFYLNKIRFDKTEPLNK